MDYIAVKLPVPRQNDENQPWRNFGEWQKKQGDEYIWGNDQALQYLLQ